MFDQNRLFDLVKAAENNGFAHTKFITPAEAEEIQRYFGTHNNGVRLDFISGFDEAERCAAVFINTDWGAYEQDEIISAIKISHRKQDEISHRDILGAVLSLGITRECVGDIFVGDTCFLVCLKSVANFISDNLDKVGKFGVKTETIPLSELPKSEKRLEEKSDTVASLRFDCVVAAMFNISRGIAAEYIVGGKAQLSHIICEKCDKEVKDGDIISVRGLGRAKLIHVGGESKKGRIWITIGKYI